MRRFIVTSIGRSGTKYISKILEGCGIPCGHEVAFRARCCDPTWEMPPIGDASWFAAPMISDLEKGALVFHQIRNPLDCIRSWIRVGRSNDDFFQKHLSFDWDQIPSPIREMRIWTEWNQLIEQKGGKRAHYFRYQLEDLNVDLIYHILEQIGLILDKRQIGQVFTYVPKDSNTYGDKSQDSKVTWDSLPDGLDKTNLFNLARQYGYKVA